MLIIFIMWLIHKTFTKAIYKILHYNTSLISFNVIVVLQLMVLCVASQIWEKKNLEVVLQKYI